MYINCKIIFYSCVKIFTNLSFRILNEFGFEYFWNGLGFRSTFSRLFRFDSIRYNNPSRVGLKFKLLFDTFRKRERKKKLFLNALNWPLL